MEWMAVSRFRPINPKPKQGLLAATYRRVRELVRDAPLDFQPTPERKSLG
jgi:hypothetical protein